MEERKTTNRHHYVNQHLALPSLSSPYGRVTLKVLRFCVAEYFNTAFPTHTHPHVNTTTDRVNTFHGVITAESVSDSFCATLRTNPRDAIHVGHLSTHHSAP